MMVDRISRRLFLAAPMLTVPGVTIQPGEAAEESFRAFLYAVSRDAAAHGIRSSTVDAALRGAEFLPHVIELDRHQPERVLTFAEYLAKTVSPARKDHARRQLFDNRSLLDAIWQRYRVEPRIIVALWGLESDFGAITGNLWWSHRLPPLATTDVAGLISAAS